jgi:GTPase SAR1 family protein
MYYQGAVGALLVYDVSIFETFKKVKSWVKTLQEAVGKDIIFVIAGNKYDLVGKMDEHMPEIDSYCSQEKCKHFFTSAKTGYGLDDVFSTLIQLVLDKVKPTGAVSGRKGKKIKS